MFLLQLSLPARVTAALLATALLWDLSGLDTWVMVQIGDSAGFSLQHDPLLQGLGHDAARRWLLAAYAVLLVALVWPARVGFAVVMGLLMVNLLKRGSLTSCPWDMADFGGVARYVSHWRWGEPDGGPGHCFPAGHVSSAAALLAVVWPWLGSAERRLRRRGFIGLAGTIGLALALGAVQTLRGAHYPSHTLWTLALCAGLATALVPMSSAALPKVAA